jgi:hypothetical protein
MKRKKSTKTQHDYLEQRMSAAYDRMNGLDIKADNIAKKYNGYVPPEVQEELDKAELEYNFYKAMWKDSD